MFGFLKSSEGKVIHVNDMEDLIGRVDIIDIRERYEYSSGSLKNAKNIPMGDLLGDPDKYLKQGTTYYIMCQSGGRSSRACGILSKRGFDVVNVTGGMGSYVGTKRK
jgi:rhodanese-related sulfurtransferase